MPLTRTITTLIARCRRRVDMANNQARDDDAFKALISEVYAEMHGIVVEAGQRIFETSVSITATGAASYSLSSLSATGHMSTTRMVRVDGSYEVPLRELTTQEEWQYKGKTGDAVGYTLVGSTITLYPNPSSGTYKLYYVPQPTDYSAASGATDVDVLCSAGERFLLWGVAALVHGELEGNGLLALRERDRAADDLRVWAAQRNLLVPRQRPAADDALGAPFDAAGEWWPYR